MSAKLNALNSDSYIDVSQYRDQHFKVSVGICSRNITGRGFNVNVSVYVESQQLATVSKQQSVGSPHAVWKSDIVIY